ncbi:Cytoplasmic thioredoxin isoenzyme 2 [Rhizophlyctis rosea]|uniref:Thioredoxin n=1 Tax=Rhizophlyctis rosea TaxID=64517 RepID=A0AAD5S4V8_9FUNG|nr:Cytoplasmic thioredoxin isoenzyme 2 [Rhizophlyctis rosea]
MVHSIASYNEFTSTLASNDIVIVDYTATWCPPCKVIAPHYEQLAADHPSIAFLKVDVDDNPDVAEEQSANAMPTFVAYKSGKEVARVVGANLPKLKQLVAGVAA